MRWPKLIKRIKRKLISKWEEYTGNNAYKPVKVVVIVAPEEERKAPPRRWYEGLQLDVTAPESRLPLFPLNPLIVNPIPNASLPPKVEEKRPLTTYLPSKQN